MLKLFASVVTLCVTMAWLASCGSKKDDSPAATPSNSTTFTNDINPILTASCGTSSCHGAGAKNGVYVDNETAFKASKSKTRIQDGTMPQAGSTQLGKFTAANKSTLLSFLSN